MATTNNSGQEKDNMPNPVVYWVYLMLLFIGGALAGQGLYTITHPSSKDSCKKREHKPVEIVVPSNP